MSEEEPVWVQRKGFTAVTEMELEMFSEIAENNSAWNIDSPAHLRYLDRLCWVWESQLKVLRYLRRQTMLDLYHGGLTKAETGKFINLKRTRAHELIEQASEERLQRQTPF
tara:strand:+ start:1529 stop:1861 length:333 start_codon:yes stop_codon:yes gene_type:complete